MTIAPFSAPQRTPTRSTATTPSAVSIGVPTTSHRGEAIGQDEDHADREVDARGDDHQRLRHRDEGEQNALVGCRLHHIGGEASRMVRGVDDEHHDEDAEREQRAFLFGEPVAPFAHQFALAILAASVVPMFSALAISACSVISAPTSSPLDRAVIEHEHAIAAADQFVIVGRVEHNRRALVGETPEQLVEFLLGADVDAARRIIEQDDARMAHQPFGDHHLLLVAARTARRPGSPARPCGCRAASPSRRAACPRPRDR